MSRAFGDGPAPERIPERIRVRILFEGREIEARAGESVAAALLRAGLRDFRTTAVSGAARGPFCMMGVCFDCLVEIDGRGNQQACMHEVRDGMRVARQNGAFDVVADLLQGDEAAT